MADSDKKPIPSASSSHEEDAPAPKRVAVTLVHARNRDLSWCIATVALGALLVLKLGTIGQGIGVLLLLVGALNGYRASKTFMNAPGTFRITADEVLLPTGLCAGPALELGKGDLQHAFFLRRAVPFTKAGPLLVVEAKGKAYAYPRDWFATDSDQRRVAAAINRVIGEAA